MGEQQDLCILKLVMQQIRKIAPMVTIKARHDVVENHESVPRVEPFDGSQEQADSKAVQVCFV